MSYIGELKIEFNSYYSNGIFYLAKNEYENALLNLNKALVALSDLSKHRSGIKQDMTMEWYNQLYADVNRIKVMVNNNKSMEKAKQTLANKHNSTTYECKDDERIKSFVPTTTFDDIAGLDDVKELVKYKVIYPRIYSELYDTFKKRSGGGILLYGLPGTGKTLIAEAIAHETNATFFPVKCSDLGSKWFGETEQNIRDVFDAAREADNAVIFFDEIESYASSRRDNSAMERSVPEFLAQMQGVGASKDRNRILVIGATNKPWKLDGAFLRPGRFDEKIYVPLPCEEARRQLIKIRLDGVPCSDLDIESYVQKTQGFNGADVDFLCEKAKENAIRRIINATIQDKFITSLDFDSALSSLRSSVLECDKVEMERWVKEYSA
ncbi:MAG: ATP-binding protein [Clostridia bacterium]|nr:ATP-binding protein [Clostridia bacterium]